MSEEDYKDVIASYQQKAFELFNQNIVYETQINSLKKSILELKSEIQVLKSIQKENGGNSYWINILNNPIYIGITGIYLKWGIEWQILILK